MATTRLGLTGPMTAYLPFQAKQFHPPPTVVPVTDILVYASPVVTAGS